MLEEKISKSIQKAIEENLPAQVSEILKQRLQLVDELEKQIHKLEQLCVDKNEYIENLEKDVKRNGNLADKEQTLCDWEQDLEKFKLELEDKERKQKMELLSKELELVKEREQTVISLVDKVFGHPSVTIEQKGATGLQQVTVDGQGYSVYGNDQRNIIETKTESKE